MNPAIKFYMNPVNLIFKVIFCSAGKSWSLYKVLTLRAIYEILVVKNLNPPKFWNSSHSYFFVWSDFCSFKVHDFREKFLGLLLFFRFPTAPEIGVFSRGEVKAEAPAGVLINQS